MQLKSNRKTKYVKLYSINSPIIKNMLSVVFNCLFIYSICSLGQTGFIIQCIFPSEPLWEKIEEKILHILCKVRLSQIIRLFNFVFIVLQISHKRICIFSDIWNLIITFFSPHSQGTFFFTAMIVMFGLGTLVWPAGTS